MTGPKGRKVNAPNVVRRDRANTDRITAAKFHRLNAAKYLMINATPRSAPTWRRVGQPAATCTPAPTTSIPAGVRLPELPTRGEPARCASHRLLSGRGDVSEI